MACATSWRALVYVLALSCETWLCASKRVLIKQHELNQKTPVGWKILERGRFCSKSVRKELADVTSVEECQKQSEDDPECRNQLYTDGKLCRCVKVGKFCDFPKSETGMIVYESFLTDYRELKVVKAGDERVHGNIVVSGVHKGRPQYMLEENPEDDSEIYWSQSDKSWRLVFDNFFGFKRSTVYWNPADQDLLPLTGWTTENMHAQPALQLAVEEETVPSVDPPAKPAVESNGAPAPAAEAPAPATGAPAPATEAPAPATEAAAPATQAPVPSPVEPAVETTEAPAPAPVTPDPISTEAPAPAPVAPAPAPVTNYVGLKDSEIEDLKNGAVIASADQIDKPICEMLKTRGHGCKLHEKLCRCKFVGPKPKTCDKLFPSEGTAFAVKGMKRYALFGKSGCECSKIGGFESQCDLAAMESDLVSFQ